MESSIAIVPAIKSLKLHHVGCWEHVALEFLPGLNIITEEGSAWGKTTIFEAIMHALMPTALEHRPPVTIGFEEGSISMEFMSTSHIVRLQSSTETLLREKMEPRREYLLSQLKVRLNDATPNYALLIEDEVAACLDEPHYAEAVKLLNSARCQVIFQISHRLDCRSFPGARIYACYEHTRGKPGMKLLQAGGNEAL